MMTLLLAAGLLAGVVGLASPFCADDVLHSGVSAVGACGLYGLARVCHVEHRAALWGSLGVMAVAGIGKEAFDAMHPDNYWSWRDLAADAVGLAVVAAAIEAGYRLTRGRRR
jgi:uncharacterized protein YfiM (DUF2279 family)